ncbi:MAG: DNA ligase, ATP-dependent, PP_1105 family [Saliniramus fredricksonii]|uniref:DNA ligase (ATP) n=1 Tax=Saliniramus fredricksonii TaxID=1653334 RepID=A0A0P7XQI6_9HYPH|nr:cisplatin damage response ATP-dependent DNA ligase [Saliniramus fredricksonii]KPQ09833.1 MAG: DNA ligase, ATP-dependent, PP_1105 family [Saliniramus fredricksonii]SCC82150.1 DNA ligase-1 [Saliniramus fredricksonii]
MQDFAALLDRLAFESGRNAKIRLLADHFARRPDPERGYALAALTGGLAFREAKAGLIRALIAERVDPVLFEMSYNYVGDLAETVALLWPQPDEAVPEEPAPNLSEVVAGLSETGKARLPALLAGWLDRLDENGRWALLKLITGSLRVGVSARLAKVALAELGPLAPDDIEEVWHGLAPPYEALFAWAQGTGERPQSRDPVPFRPPMLAHPLDESDLAGLDPGAFVAEWKWDGIRVQAACARDGEGRLVRRIYSRTGEDISPAFPDLLEILPEETVIDGELLVLREGRVQSFNVLQQRLNRKSVSRKLMADYPAHIRAYDLLARGSEDLRPLPFMERRAALEAAAAGWACARIDVSPLVPFADRDALAAARIAPQEAGAGADATAVEGLMLKRADSPYLPGRPKGQWFKWKRDPHLVDAVLMYAQRGHGKRSSYYSDFTFGVWREEPEGWRIVPVGKAYFGFTDAELGQLDRHVRAHTRARYGPVREVAHGGDEGLVLEIAFEGLQRSPRHKSGIAMRFPRIHRIRWDKPAAQADSIDSLLAILEKGEREMHPLGDPPPDQAQAGSADMTGSGRVSKPGRAKR